MGHAALDYCYKNSYGRGVGEIPTQCSTDQDMQGTAPFFTCYDECPDGYSSTDWGGCMQTCPSGTKRDDYGNCVENSRFLERYETSKYTIWENPNPDECYFPKYNLSKIGECFMAECNKANPELGCQWNGGDVVAKCKENYKMAALHCIPDLDCTDFVGKGVDFYGNTFCETTRKSPRPPQPAYCGKDKSGHDKVNDAGLCYPQCGANAVGVGPVCWEGCPTVRGKKWVECGAGCAADATACGLATMDMTISVLDAAISIASLGSAAAASKGGLAAIKTGMKDGVGDALKATAKQYGNTFSKRFTGHYKDAVSSLTKEGMKKAGLVQDMATLQSTARGVATFFGAVEDIVGKDISQEEMDFQIAQQALGYASLLDPSGVMGIVAAYTKPLCSVIANGSGSYPAPEITAPDNQPLTTGAAESLLAEASKLHNVIATLKEGDKAAAEALCSDKPALSGLDAAGALDNYYTLSSRWMGDKQLLTAGEHGVGMMPGFHTATIDKPEPGFDKGRQLWKIRKGKTGYYKLVPALHAHVSPTQSLDISARDQVRPVIANSADVSGQYWKLSASEFGRGSVRLTTMWRGDCNYLDIIRGGPAHGSTMLRPRRDHTAQAWILNKTSIMTAVRAKTPEQLREGYMNDIEANFGSYVTAAHSLPNNSHTDLWFKDNTHSRFGASKTEVDSGYPKNNPGHFRGIPADWNASFNAILPYGGTSKSYIFKNGLYLRLSDGITVDSGYPQRMPGGWQGMPTAWRGNVDAALYYPPNGKHYMFRGNEYVRLSGVKVDAGYPIPLPGGWRGMPAHFTAGIDAATTRNGQVYMFKNNEYIRFTGTQMDPGYPKPVSTFPH